MSFAIIILFFILFYFLFVLLFLIVKRLNSVYYILNLSKRVRTIDGSDLESKVPTMPGKTIFGNNFDFDLKATPETVFKFLREKCVGSKGKCFMTHFFTVPFYNVTNPIDAEEVFQSPTLITKSFIYDIIKPFLGQGLLISTDEKWQFRRKILTPAFHFNILQTFIEIFKEESYKFNKVMNQRLNEVISLDEVIPQFTLNNVCETALGVKLDEVPGSELYRKAVNDMEPLLIERLCNSFMYIEPIYWLFGSYKQQKRLIQITNDFSSKVIEKRRKDFQESRRNQSLEKVDDFGKKRRYAMLDTLLDAETQGLIDHQGILDEVNTFMFEGFDTTSICLMFAIMNLAVQQDVQDKCYEEIENLAPFDTLTVFDFNKLEYLECVIKETLRLYPSVPFISRTCVTETILNGLILPKNCQVNVHIFHMMRDERYFPEPEKFDPERFRPENTTNRHPFAFVPFSAGPRNCIGQKFAMLEVKVLLVALLKNFRIVPETTLDNLTFENGLVLRCKEKLNIRVVKRV